jgi:hypothetical protein
MDDIIPYDDISEMLKSPPTLAPRPNFFRLRLFRLHIVDQVKQIPHPNYPQHGWMGMVQKPTIFALVNALPFVPPTNPGLIALYPPYALLPATKMIDNQFKIDKNMYKTYTNIHRAIYKLLTDNVLHQYQSSGTPGLTGWDPSMSIINIFDQLDATFGKPDAQAVLANDTVYRTPLRSNETPESLFRRLEECQEVQVLADNPYTDKQLIVHAVLLLRQSAIFPNKEFEDWDNLPDATKTWAGLKTFFHTAFTRRLTAIALNPTSGQHGYANANPFSAFNIAHDTDSASTTSSHHTLTQTIAATGTVPTTDSTFASSFAAHTAPEVTSALAQLAANQNSLLLQMAALSVVPPPQPPIQHINIPTQQFTRGGGGRGGQFRTNSGQNGGYGGGYGANYGGSGYGGYGGDTNSGGAAQRRRNGRRGRGTIPQYGTIQPAGGQMIQYGRGVPGQRTNVPNPVKRYNNLNYCFSCGYDVEDQHTSKTCLSRKEGHQTECNRNNVQQYMAAGHFPSLKGQHKNQMPTQF